MSGRSSLDVGKDSERRVATYLRSRGLVGVERAVRTGFSAGGRTVAEFRGPDRLARRLRPGQESAAGQRSRTTGAPVGWAETELQRDVRRQRGAAGGAPLGHHRRGRMVGLPDRLRAAGHGGGPLPPALSLHPVRLELSDLVDMMAAWGWVPELEVTP